MLFIIHEIHLVSNHDVELLMKKSAGVRLRFGRDVSFSVPGYKTYRRFCQVQWMLYKIKITYLAPFALIAQRPRSWPLSKHFFFSELHVWRDHD